jgi:hypothetical protein
LLPKENGKLIRELSDDELDLYLHGVHNFSVEATILSIDICDNQLFEIFTSTEAQNGPHVQAFQINEPSNIVPDSWNTL